MHACLLFALLGGLSVAAPGPYREQPDLIIRHAKVVTADVKFAIVEALAIRGDRLLALGNDAGVLRLRGPKTRVIDAGGRTVLPGLYDSHTHPVLAATSELAEPIP